MEQERQRQKKDRKQAKTGSGGTSAKLRGLPKDSHETRISKTVSWILRHGSQAEGLAMRPDGYVCVDELLKSPKMREVDFATLQELVKKDNKNRFNLLFEPDKNSSSTKEVWWIRANQGHSMKSVVLDLQPIGSLADIPTGIAVHGTTRKAWEIIRDQGISKMSRNHIHLAQGVAGSGVISGMRSSSQVLIFIDVQKAIDAGFLSPQFFARVETADRKPLLGWEGTQDVQKAAAVMKDVDTTVETTVVSESAKPLSECSEEEIVEKKTDV
ncbi:putative tRNA 2'-phosphotransferase [Grifola frondosa]|uniref:2'-phosphotransferase n=1 Tax=Grifola frondosa TaxID=5627 RepID=A0A1C7MAJ0_GRIFR|nr:putative tRNA 2'-phosphotransferase [Grifola frondosa]